MNKELKILDRSDWRILKVIRVVGPEWNPFTANFAYKRTFTNFKNWKDADALDNAILEAVKKAYPNSYLAYNDLQFYNSQFENTNWLRFAAPKPITIIFRPDIELTEDNLYDILDKTLKEYHVTFEWQVGYFQDDKRYNAIYPIEVVKLDETQLNRFIKTIEPVRLGITPEPELNNN